MLRNNAGPTCALSMQGVKASVAQRCSLPGDAHLGESERFFNTAKGRAVFSPNQIARQLRVSAGVYQRAMI